MDPIEQVVALCPELHFDTFGEAQGLLQNHVPVINSWAVEMVAPKVARAVPRWIGEQTDIRSGLRARIADWRWSTSGIEIRTLLLAGVGRIGSGKDVIRKTAGCGRDPSHFPAFENPSCQPFGQVVMPATDGKYPGVVDHHPLSYVEIGVTALGGEVERVTREFLVAG